MVVSLLGGCCGGLLSFAVCFAYPAHLTAKLLFGCCDGGKALGAASPSREVGGGVYEYVHWTAFWIIYLGWQFCEQSVMAPLVPWIPLYYELKSLLFYWLCSDRFRGAGWLWLEVVELFYRPVSMKLADAFNKQCPDSVKIYFGCPPASPPEAVGGGAAAAAAPRKKVEGSADGGAAPTAANVFEESRAVASAVGKESLS